MKKLLLIVALTFAIQGLTSVSGQPYYSTEGIITGSGYNLYIQKPNNTSTKIYSPGDVLVNTVNRNKDGSFVSEAIFEGYIPLADYPEWRDVVAEIRGYCNGLFSFFEKLRIRNDLLGISIYMYIDTTDDPGSVKEVMIRFYNDESAFNIHPIKYYRLIQWIKQNIRFNLTEAGLNLNYVSFVAGYEGKL